MDKMFCKICNKPTKYTRQTFARHHLKKEHDLTSREYYDITKAPEEGFCKTCEKPTLFHNIKEGYKVFCSSSCSNRDPENVKKAWNTRSKREKEKYSGKTWFQTEEYKQISKEAKIKKYGNENYCNKEKIKTTKIERYGDENYCNKEKIKTTILDRYGSFNYIYEKTKATCLNKYGVNNYFQAPEFRKMMEDEEKWVPLNSLTEYEIYRRRVKSTTKLFKKALFSSWDGYCFYSNEKLTTNSEWKIKNPNKHVCKNPLQPTIDHKISIVHGFINNISYETIGDIKNLCICSRDVNLRKNHKTEKQYKEKLKWVQETEVDLDQF